MKRAFVTILVALFATVVFGSTKIEIKPGDLPACIHEWVKKNLVGYTIDKAYKVETKGENSIIITYYARATKAQVKPAKGSVSVWVMSDPNCSNIKKITQKEADAAMKEKPPVQ